MPESPPLSTPSEAGWDAAALNTLRDGARLSLYEKLKWLEEIEEVFLNLQRSRRVEPPRSAGASSVAGPPPPTEAKSPLA